jgi:hypothetical protein
MKAADVDDARALFEHQEIKSLREDIAAKYPELVWPHRADGKSSSPFPPAAHDGVPSLMVRAGAQYDALSRRSSCAD